MLILPEIVHRILLKKLQSITLLEICLIVLIGLGIFFRTYHFGSVPLGTYWDETAMMADVKSILTTGSDMHGLPWFQTIFPSYGDYKLPLYIWFTLPIARIIGVTQTSIRLVSWFIGIGTLLVVGMLSGELAGLYQIRGRKKRLLLLSTVVALAVSPWAIMFSRAGFEAYASQLCIGLSVVCLLQSRKNMIWVLLAALFGAIAVYGYFSSIFVWPLLYMSGLGLVWFMYKTTFRKIVLWGVAGLVLFGVLTLPLFSSQWFAPMQQFRLSTESVMNSQPFVNSSQEWRSWSEHSVLSKLVFSAKFLQLKAFTQHVTDFFSIKTLFLKGDGNLRHSTTIHGLYLLSLLPSFVFGLFSLWRKKSVVLFLAIWWFLAVVPAAVPAQTPHALRSLNALLPSSLIIGFGLYELLRFAQKKTVYRIFSYCYLVIIMVEVLWFGVYYFMVYPVLSAQFWQAEYIPLTQTIFENRKSHQPVLLLLPDGRYYLWLLAYGPYSGSEFSGWQSTHFIKESFDSFYWGTAATIDFSNKLLESGEGLVVGMNQDLETFEASEIGSKLNLTCSTLSSETLVEQYQICQASP